ncbi:cytochrome c oxidase subunit 4 [Spirillospora sp. NPDC049652]
MRVQAFMFYGCAIFFLATDVVYWLWSKDWTGTTALALAVGLSGLIGFYVHFTIRRLEGANGGPLYEDDPQGEIADAAGELGFFSPHSWWPLYIGGSAAFVSLGMVFGWWMVLLGGAGLLLSTVGLVFEYYRGHFAH